MEESIRSESFRVGRLPLAYLAVTQYVRTFWWFVAIIPLFGLVATIFGDGILRVMGLMALLWPISLPARAIVATSKVGKLLEKGAWASLEDGVLYLHGKDGKGQKLSLREVRRIEWRRGFVVLILSRGQFLALPEAGIGQEFAEKLEETAKLAGFHEHT